jgi:hypothetical protein
VSPRPVRTLIGGIALGCFALFAVRTAPNALGARVAFGEAREVLESAEEDLARIPAETGEDAEDVADWRRRRLEAAGFLAGALAEGSRAPEALPEDRRRILGSLARPRLPEQLLGHLLPQEDWEREGRVPSAEENLLAWRKLRLASALLETLVGKGVADFDFLVFPEGGREVPGGAGNRRVRVRIQYAAPVAVHAEAYQALVGRRERGPFFLPDRLQIVADPAGGGPDRVRALLEAHVPLLGAGPR